MTRKCDYRGCGHDFVPRDTRQRYCEYACKQRELVAKRTTRCLNCEKDAAQPARFCSSACQWSYSQTKRPGRKPRSFVPVIVLLPAGCNPIRSVALPVAPESTERLGGGQTYGEIARRVWCARYERCLSHAVSKNWDGFDCSKCDVDESTAPEPGENKKGGNWSW